MGEKSESRIVWCIVLIVKTIVFAILKDISEAVMNDGVLPRSWSRATVFEWLWFESGQSHHPTLANRLCVEITANATYRFFGPFGLSPQQVFILDVSLMLAEVVIVGC